MVPIKVSVRQRIGLPIVEIKGECDYDGAYRALLETALQIIEIAEKEKAHLLPNEPREEPTAKNQILFTLVFQNEEKAGKFIQMLPYIT